MLLGALHLGAAPALGVQVLFTSGDYTTPVLRTIGNGVAMNNRGQVLYAFFDGPAEKPGLWLPRPDYGLPAGLNDLHSVAAPGYAYNPVQLTDDGTYYSLVQLPHAANDSPTLWWKVFRGDANGQGQFADNYTIGPQGSAWYGTGVTVEGVRFGVGNNNDGLFVGTEFYPMPSVESHSVCPQAGFVTRWFSHGTSKHGLSILRVAEGCGSQVFGIDNLLATSLVLVGPGGGRYITTHVQGQAPPAIDPASTPVSLNDLGDVAGFDGSGVWYSPAVGGVRRNGLTNVTQILLNNLGVALINGAGPDGTGLYVWNEAGLTFLNMPWAAYGLASSFGMVAFNDRGEILGFAHSPTNVATGQIVMLSPVLDERLATSASRLSVGDLLTITATATNISPDLLTGVAPAAALSWTGDAGFEVVDGPQPDAVPSLLPDAAAVFRWTLRATNLGTTVFSVAVSAQRGGVAVETPPASTGTIKVLDRPGDLAIKRDDEADAAYATDGFQVPEPAGAQVLTTLVRTNRPGVFDVRLRNIGKLPRAFTLLGRENAGQTVPGWQSLYAAGVQDIGAALLDPAGFVTPTLPTNGTFALRITLSPTNAPPNGRFVVSVIAVDSPAAPEAMDAVETQAVFGQVPVELKMYRATAGALTQASIDAGKTDIDAPLVPSSDPAALEVQPPIDGGLVADGVTPLLLSFSAFALDLQPLGHPQKVLLRAQITGGGSLAGPDLSSRLRVLNSGAWSDDLHAALDAASPQAWAYVTPIGSDELQLDSPPDLFVRLEVVTDDADAVVLGSKTIRIRRPPIALIHGYNTLGDWGEGVLAILRGSRGGFYDVDHSFVQVCKYGLRASDGSLGFLTRGSIYENTLLPLRDLVPIVEASFGAGISPLTNQWAFTRHDVVAHSQGGLLTRMLCSVHTNDFLAQPFRNPDNFYRGRFHRVVTIGSPHNGTRLLRYLLTLSTRDADLLAGTLPALVGGFMVVSDTAQEKFDPFGEQIRELNDPRPSGPWQPDPAARFHLMRAVINGGLPPSALHFTPADLALGLAGPGGQLVIPRGSDGVVDFDSMGAHSPVQPVGANVFLNPPEAQTSHSAPLFLWNAQVAETDSLLIAQHVIQALDQDPTLPPGDRVFGRFTIPGLLTDDIRDGIDGWVALLTPSSGEVFTDNAPRPQGPTGGGEFRFKLVPPAGTPVGNIVEWSAFALGPDGPDPTGLTVTPRDNDPTHVTLTVDPAVAGDILLYVTYQSGTNTVCPPPVFVGTQGFADSDIAGVEVIPDELSVPVGGRMPVQIYVRLNDGREFLRHLDPSEIKVSNSNPAAVDVANPLNWRALAPGTATVTTTYKGFAVNSVLSVLPSAPLITAVNLEVALAANQIVLSWPAAAGGAIESAPSLGAPASWQALPGTPTNTSGRLEMTLPVTAEMQFYRLNLAGGGTGVPTDDQLRGTYGWNRTGNGGLWSDPANWDTTALAGGAPVTNGVGLVDVRFGAAATPVVSTVDGSFAVRSLTFDATSPGVHLVSGPGASALTLGTGGIVKSGAGDDVVDPTVVLDADQTWTIDDGTVTLAALDLHGQQLSVGGSGILVIARLSGVASAGLVATGPGQVHLLAGAAPAFGGSVAVAGGNLSFDGSSLDAAAGVSLTGGTLSLPAGFDLASPTPLRFGGGVIDATAAQGSFGAVQLSGENVLRLGAGTNSLRFASIALADATGHLSVTDWTGTAGSAGTGRKLFATASPASTVLAKITFIGTDFDTASKRLGTGELVPLAKPTVLLPADAATLLLAYGSDVTAAVVAVDGQSFSTAVELTTSAAAAQPYDSGATLTTTAAVTSGDNLVARFWIRRTLPASGAAKTQFNFEKASGNFDKSVQTPLTLTDGNWHQQTVKFKSAGTYAVGAAEVSFWLGYGVQTIQIGGLELLDYRGVTPP